MKQEKNMRSRFFNPLLFGQGVKVEDVQASPSTEQQPSEQQDENVCLVDLEEEQERMQLAEGCTNDYFSYETSTHSDYSSTSNVYEEYDSNTSLEELQNDLPEHPTTVDHSSCQEPCCDYESCKMEQDQLNIPQEDLSQSTVIVNQPIQQPILVPEYFQKASLLAADPTKAIPVCHREDVDSSQVPLIEDDTSGNELENFIELKQQLTREMNIKGKDYNVVFAGCRQSGKSQLKSLLHSIMTSNEEKRSTFQQDLLSPMYKRLDQSNRTSYLVQDRCDFMERKFLFSDLPGLESCRDASSYVKMITSLYMGVYDNQIYEQRSFESKRTCSVIKEVFHDVVILTIPIDYSCQELDSIRMVQSELENRNVPYLIVATKVDHLNRSRRDLEERKRQLAQSLHIRSFDILTIGMRGKSEEGLRDFERIDEKLYLEALMILRQIVVISNRVRNHNMHYSLCEYLLFCLCNVIRCFCDFHKQATWSLETKCCKEERTVLEKQVPEMVQSLHELDTIVQQAPEKKDVNTCDFGHLPIQSNEKESLPHKKPKKKTPIKTSRIKKKRIFQAMVITLLISLMFQLFFLFLVA